MRTLLLALALFAPALAGCISASEPLASADGAADLANLSAAVYGLLPGESIFYEASSDGTQLHMRLFRPDAGDAWKAPTILVMSPYFGPDSRAGYDQADPRTWDAAAAPAYWRYQWLVDHFVPRGYAVAFSDVRGTGESGGCLEQTGPLQTQDGYDTVEWLGSQPWSNGKVGMYGKSYDGETQQSTATLAPPSLVTIIPVSSVAGQYDYSYYGAVPYTLQTMLVNVGYAIGDGLQPGSTVQAHLTYSERIECNVGHFAQGADESGTWNDYWDTREIRLKAEGVKASVLYVHGLQDWNVKPSNIRDWYERLDVPKMALLGQWAHDYPEQNTFNADWSRQDWQELVWRWYDHWLLGRDTGIESMLGTTQVQDSRGDWRAQKGFPAEDAVPTTLWFSGTGDLGPATEPADGRFQEPDLALAGEFRGFLPVQRATEAAAWRTPALEEDLRWSGWPTMSIDVSLDKDDAHFVAWLVDIAPDGKSKWVNRAYLSAQHRDGLTAAKAVPVGQVITYELQFFPSDTVIEKGHQLEVILMGVDDWVSGSGNGWTATLTQGSLTLPVVTPAESAFLDVPLGDPIKAPVV